MFSFIVNNQKCEFLCLSGKLYDPSPEIQKEYKAELARIAQQYGGVKPEEMTKFPKFTFQGNGLFFLIVF